MGCDTPWFFVSILDAIIFGIFILPEGLGIQSIGTKKDQYQRIK